MIFQQLHDSEINFQVSSFYDGLITIKLGDKLNGWKEEQIVSSWGEVTDVLRAMTKKHYPYFTEQLSH